MSHLRIPGDSVETIRIPVATLTATGTLDDPTATTVEIGFSASQDTEPTSWLTATWETSETVKLTVGAKSVDTPYKATILVGAGAADLAAGLWAVWVRITDTPEIPVRFAGWLEVI